jgi:predicted membrane channel-forming protein YqfA (hemolysin III family)
MLYRELIAVCSQIHTKHIHTLCGQNVELLNVKLVVYIVTAVFYMDKRPNSHNYSKVKILYCIAEPSNV